MKCHDPLQVVDELLEEGADPNLPLGRGVGTALCTITTHTALKKRDISSSLALVSRSLSHNLPWHQSIPSLATVGVTAHQMWSRCFSICQSGREC